MARRKKGKCKWGRRKDGLCRKRPRGRRRAAKKGRRQAKPTPLFADIVQHARKGQRFACHSDARIRFVQEADSALKAQVSAFSALPSAEAKLRRQNAYRRAHDQLATALRKGCASFERRERRAQARAEASLRMGRASGWRPGNGLGPAANQSHFFTEPTPPSSPSGGGGSPPKNPPPSPFDPGSIRPPPTGGAAALPRMRKDLKPLYFDWVAQHPNAGTFRDAFVKAPPKVARVHTFAGDKLEIVRSNTGGTLRIRKPTYHRNQKNPRVIEPLQGEFVVLRENKKNGQATVMRRGDYDQHLTRYFQRVAYEQKHGPARQIPSPVPEAVPDVRVRSSYPALEPMNLHTPMPSSMPVLEPGPDPFSVPPNWPGPEVLPQRRGRVAGPKKVEPGTGKKKKGSTRGRRRPAGATE